MRRSPSIHKRRHRQRIVMMLQAVALQFSHLTGINITSVGANINSGKQHESRTYQNHYRILPKPFHNNTKRYKTSHLKGKGYLREIL